MPAVRNAVGVGEMITMQAFVSRIRFFDRSPELLFAECCETPLHMGSTAVTTWGTWEITQTVFRYFEESPFVTVTSPAGFYPLPRRDEDAILLFTMLWELEK